MKMVKEGIYEFRSIKDIPEILRKKHFRKISGKNWFQINQKLKDKVVFKTHDFLRELPPSENIHIIFVRNNLLTYYKPSLKNSAFEKNASSLIPGGLLIIGSHERIPQTVTFLKHHSKSAFVFVREKPDYDHLESTP